MMEETYTKAQAIELMKQGIKVTHFCFLSDEWMTIEGDNILTEDGISHNPAEFWKYRSEDYWQYGYSVWKQKSNYVRSR